MCHGVEDDDEKQHQEERQRAISLGVLGTERHE